jgi:hypothetical protein
VVVEIPDDDSPPPGWDQWVSFPTLSPESQEGVLVRRRDSHMVQEAEGTVPRPLLPALAAPLRKRGALTVRPPSPTTEEQELWGELRDHGAALNRALNEALQIHGGPAWRVFQVRHRRLLSLISSSSRSIFAA